MSTSTPPATATPTHTPTSTHTATMVPTHTPTSTPTAIVTPTQTPTSTPPATAVPTHTPTSMPTITATPTHAPTSAHTATAPPTEVPTNTPMPTARPAYTPTSTPIATATPTHTPTRIPTSTAVPTHTPTSTPTATTSPTPFPSCRPYALSIWLAVAALSPDNVLCKPDGAVFAVVGTTMDSELIPFLSPAQAISVGGYALDSFSTPNQGMRGPSSHVRTPHVQVSLPAAVRNDRFEQSADLGRMHRHSSSSSDNTHFLCKYLTNSGHSCTILHNQHI
jgi:hypothetical protein